MPSVGSGSNVQPTIRSETVGGVAGVGPWAATRPTASEAAATPSGRARPRRAKPRRRSRVGRADGIAGIVPQAPTHGIQPRLSWPGPTLGRSARVRTDGTDPVGERSPTPAEDLHG